MEHRTTLDTMPHNLVTRLEPRIDYLPIAELWEIPEERALAENAVWHFLTNNSWSESDKEKCQVLYHKYGVNMFVWKYYAAARCYLGGYSALSGTLMLRKLR